MGRKRRERIAICGICETPFKPFYGDKYCSRECGAEATGRKALEREVHGASNRAVYDELEKAGLSKSKPPTGKEIEVRCLEIQDGRATYPIDGKIQTPPAWDEEKRRRRAGLLPLEAEFKEVNVTIPRQRCSAAT